MPQHVRRDTMDAAGAGGDWRSRLSDPPVPPIRPPNEPDPDAPPPVREPPIPIPVPKDPPPPPLRA